MKSATLKVINELCSLFALCEQLEAQIPSLKNFNSSIRSFSEMLSSLPQNTPLVPVLGLCIKTSPSGYSTLEQKVLLALIREKVHLGLGYLRASKDKKLDPSLISRTQEIIDQKD